MKHIFEAVLLFLLVGCSYYSTNAQAPSIQWSHSYGGSSIDEANAAVQTRDSGYVISGYTSSTDFDVSGNHGGEDFWVVKTDVNGILTWGKCLGGSGYEEATSVEQTTDGGYIVGGISTSNDGDVSGNHGGYDIWITKLDNSGNLQWQRSFGGTAEDGVAAGVGTVVIVEQTFNGGYIVGSHTKSIDGNVTGNHGDLDYWLARLDSSGNLEWEKCYGGSAEDQLKDMHQTNDGGFILAGRTISTDGDVLGDSSGIGGNWIVKTDSGGVIEWQQFYSRIDMSDHSGNGSIGLSSILQQPNNEYIAAGTIYYTGWSYYYCITKIDSSGNIINTQEYYYPFSNYNFCNSIKGVRSNSYILAGNSQTSQHFYVVKDGPGGAWTFDSGNLFNSSVFCKSAIETYDEGFAIIGTSPGDSIFSLDPYQFRLIKLGGTVSAKNNNILQFFLSNLTDHNLSLSFSTLQTEKLKLNVLDITGRNLFQTQLTTSVGTNKKEFEVGAFAKGIYIVSLSGENGSESVKVVKE